MGIKIWTNLKILLWPEDKIKLDICSGLGGGRCVVFIFAYLGVYLSVSRAVSNLVTTSHTNIKAAAISEARRKEDYNGKEIS